MIWWHQHRALNPGSLPLPLPKITLNSRRGGGGQKTPRSVAPTCHMNHESRHCGCVCVCAHVSRARVYATIKFLPTDGSTEDSHVCVPPDKRSADRSPTVPSPVPHRVTHGCIRAFVQDPGCSEYVFNTHQESQKYMLSRRHNQRLFPSSFPRLSSPRISFLPHTQNLAPPLPGPLRMASRASASDSMSAILLRMACSSVSPSVIRLRVVAVIVLHVRARRGRAKGRDARM